PITTDYSGRYLYLRIFSNFAGGVGIYAGPHRIKIGNENALLKALIKENSDNVMIGFLLIFIGVFSIFIFFIRFNRRRVLPLMFGAFAFFLGVFYVSVDESGFLFVGPEVLRYYLRLVSYLMFPVGMYAFIERILGGQIILRRIWQLHLLYGTIALVLDVFNILPLPKQQTYYSWFFVTTIVTTFIIVLKAAWHGIWEARIFLAGFLLFGLTGLHDILMGLEIIPPWEWLSQWGALIFVLSLGYLVERNFAQTRRKLERYSKELEIKTRKLNKYSQVLEEKVAERTQDLNRKNQELEDTLIQLKEMQQQLIFREKMASLGNLVAGVAHEVNNPIGAVNSSADVSARCIVKIEHELEKNSVSHKQEIDSRIRKPLRLLKESTGVIVTAGQRISEIVKSLKNFARLDESEYQKASIREGIESTLTLLRHKLKDRVEIVREYRDIPEIECFPNQLNQVFMNIIINAAQAIENKGIIRIKTFQTDGKVCVEISDTGKGIPADRMHKIFDPGFTTKSRGVGTGLGLSISYNIIEKHNGEIKVTSEVGKGTTFTILLPVKQIGNHAAKLER
ncbi:MAG: ATP-binding protein, partial [Calditrichia bacterium]